MGGPSCPLVEQAICQRRGAATAQNREHRAGPFRSLADAVASGPRYSRFPMRFAPLLALLTVAGCLDADRLLREGRAAEVLARVRPVRPVDYRRRALALRA